MSGLREFLNTPLGKGISGTVYLAALGVAFFMVRDAFSGSDAAQLSRSRPFVCSETGKSFMHSVEIGETTPIQSPYSEKPTGYPAEQCNWTKDGKSGDEITYVLLNESVGKPGPTFCPTCGRLVVNHNNPAAEGVRPPPTKAENESRTGRATPEK